MIGLLDIEAARRRAAERGQRLAVELDRAMAEPGKAIESDNEVEPQRLPHQRSEISNCDDHRRAVTFATGAALSWPQPPADTENGSGQRAAIPAAERPDSEPR
jgi:hypothetical protein